MLIVNKCPQLQKKKHVVVVVLTFKRKYVMTIFHISKLLRVFQSEPIYYTDISKKKVVHIERREIVCNHIPRATREPAMVGSMRRGKSVAGDETRFYGCVNNYV